jgi:hypothetical protein
MGPVGVRSDSSFLACPALVPLLSRSHSGTRNSLCLLRLQAFFGLVPPLFRKNELRNTGYFSTCGNPVAGFQRSGGNTRRRNLRLHYHTRHLSRSVITKCRKCRRFSI